MIAQRRSNKELTTERSAIVIIIYAHKREEDVFDFIRDWNEQGSLSDSLICYIVSVTMT